MEKEEKIKKLKEFFSIDEKSFSQAQDICKLFIETESDDIKQLLELLSEWVDTKEWDWKILDRTEAFVKELNKDDGDKTLRKYLLELQDLVDKNPEYLDLPVVYSKDDE